MPSKRHSLRPYCKILLQTRQDSKSEPTEYDITKFLGDTGSVMLSKSIDDPAGTFSIQFPDMPTPLIPFGRRDSLYGFTEPMHSTVKIYLDREQRIPKGMTPPIPTMRGFVRDVRRTESISEDGRPQRVVTISGHDTQIAFSIFQLGDMHNIARGAAPMPGSVMIDAHQLLPVTTKASKFMEECIKSVTTLLRSGGFSMRLETDVEDAYVYPQTINGNEGALWQMMDRMAGKPWSQLYVKEGKDSSILCYKQTPWIMKPGDYGLERDIFPYEIQSMTSHRSDADVANVILVLSALDMFSANDLRGQQLVSGDGKTVDPNNSFDVFGFRISQVQDYQGPGDAPISQKEKAHLQAMDRFTEWKIRRANLLRKAMLRTADLEDGTITVYGRTDLDLGSWVRVQRGELRYYAFLTGVTHTFTPYREFLSTYSFIRSTQYIERVQFQNPWDVERGEYWGMLT